MLVSQNIHRAHRPRQHRSRMQLQVFSTRLSAVRCGKLHTYYQIRVKLLCDWHDHLLERIHVVTITHSLTGPGYVDISESVISKWFKIGVQNI